MPVAKTPVVSDDRACIECEQLGTATLQCEACDGALYCEDCDAMVHRPKVMRGHERSTLPPVVVKAPRPMCNECETEEAVSKCDDCDTTYCAACDASVHRFKSLRNHQRTPIDDDEADVQVSAVSPQPKQETASMKTSTKTTTAVATAKSTLPVMKAVETYVDSVPQYDLPSESDSSDDEEEEEDDEEESGAVAAMKAATRTVVAQPNVDSSSEEEDDDEEEEDAESTPMHSATPVTAYVESVPKYDLSSESEDEDSDDDDVKAPAPLSSVTPAKKAAQLPPPVSPTKLYVRLPADVSSESSDDDDFDDERPVMPAPSAGVSTEKKTSQPSLDISSESSSDEEDERLQSTVPVARTSITTSKRKASTSSSSSSSDSDDSDEDDEPAAKQPRQEEPPKTTKRSTPASTGHSNGKAGGISEGNTHSVVKKIEAYASSDRSDVLHLDANLNGFERLLAHDCAERLGLRHVSVGEGLERHITISRHDGDKRAALKRSAAADTAGHAKKAKKNAGKQ
ncbi:hypothetical protein PINS_up011018 [Pythium insidiosum]|nr:hypothetical protein PINS_up011018 [Pythium insidiosum]